MLAILLLFTLITPGVAGQTPPDDIRISLNLEQVSVRTFFDTLKSKTGLSFVYSNEVASAIGQVTIKVEQATTDEVLRKILTPKNLTYSIEGKIVTIAFLKKQGNTRTVSGKISDTEGEPLIGVTVHAPGIKKHALTDIDGNYMLEIPQEQNVEINFSFVGMQPQSKTFAKGSNNLVHNVVLQSNTQLKDVVVTGIFTRSSGSFTGSASTITSQELMKVGNQNVLQSLKNIDPTVYIPDNLLSGSDPNQLPDLSMRGTSSLPLEETGLFQSQYSNQPNQPLFILDGFEASLSKIVDLDMNRIESVTILKDASAKALYGSKAANGVIVIETKKMMGNQQRVTYNGSLSLEMPDLTSYNLTNSLEKLDVEWMDGYYSSSTLDGMDTRLNLYNARKKRALEGLDTYWLSKPLRTGVGQKHNLSIELGDSESLRATADFTYNLINGAMKGSQRRNVGTSVNLSYRTKNLLFRNVLTYLDNKSENSPYGTFDKYARMNPYWEATDAQGNILRWAETDIPNPMYDAIIGTSLTSNYTEFTDNLYAEWQMTPEWKSVLRFGFTQNKSGGDDFYPATHSKFASTTTTDLSNRGQYTLKHGQMQQITADLNVRYTKSFTNSLLFVNAGVSASESNSSEYRHIAEGFPNSNLADITFARRYLENSVPSGGSTRKREASFLLTASYDYDSRYMIDATVRESASSLYGDNKRWANSWSLGAGWNLHNESWLKAFEPLKQLKVRASLGLTGNQQFNTSTAVSTYRYYSGIVYGGQTGAYLSNMPNPDLKWEQKMDYNVGLDTRIYGLNLSLDIYRSNTKNMLTTLTIPTSTGFGVVKDNLGLVRNEGIEVKASYALLKNAHGFLNLYGTIASNKNRIIRLSESLKVHNEKIRKASRNSSSGVVALYEDGMSMTTIWAVPSAGIDPGRGTEVYIKQDGSYTYDYDPTDLRPLGDSNPKYRGTFGVNAEYKGIGVNITCSYFGGGQLYNSTLVEKVENANIYYNVDKRLAEGRWRNYGQVTRFKRFGSGYNQTKPTSRFIQDWKELRIASLSLYYTVPAKWYTKMGMKYMKLSCNLNDLATFSSIQIERGTAYPFARNLSMSLTATF